MRPIAPTGDPAVDRFVAAAQELPGFERGHAIGSALAAKYADEPDDALDGALIDEVAHLIDDTDRADRLLRISVLAGIALARVEVQ